jgi:hypothetical protein
VSKEGMLKTMDKKIAKVVISPIVEYNIFLLTDAELTVYYYSKV